MNQKAALCVLTTIIALLLIGNGKQLHAQCSTPDFQSPVHYGVSSNPYSVATGDFNHDGNIDVAVANYGSSTVGILLGVGTGSFGTPTNYAVGGGPVIAVASGDFNNDNNMDIATCNWSGTFSVLFGNGVGGFGSANNFNAGTRPRGITTGDINEDGNDDVIVALEGQGQVAIAYGNGSGGFSAPSYIGAGAGPDAVIAADFDNDENLDLLVSNNNGNNIAILIGNGSGGFSAPNYYAVPGQPASIVEGDFNSDGNLDFAVANFHSDNASVFLGTGTGTFGGITNYASGNGPFYIETDDFNGDGILDLVVANSLDDNVGILLGTGSGTFGTVTTFAVGDDPRGIASADFDGNSKADIVTANFGAHNISILLNNCTPPPIPDVVTLATVTGECGAIVTTSPTANEGVVVGTTTNPLTYTEQGTYTITWSYDDGVNLPVTQPQTVIVNDLSDAIPDVATLPSLSGECAYTITTAPTATDNCAGSITGTTTDPLTYSEQGTYTLTWTYNDGHGNIATQEQTVVIEDVTTPNADLASLEVITGECTATIAVAPTATDNCTGVLTGTTTDALTYSEQGVHIVTWSYDDGNGNISTQNQTVVIDDVTKPIADLSELPTLIGDCSLTITSIPTATDNCTGTVTATTSDPLTYTDKGIYEIAWTYDDGNGNTTTQHQTVILNDVTGPVPNVATLPTLTGVCSYTLTTAPTATDGCTGATTGVLGIELPITFYDQGTYELTWYYLDDNGNYSEQAQTIVIEDDIPPAITVSVTPTELWPANHNLETITATVSATDNCSDVIWELYTITSNELDSGISNDDVPDDIQNETIGTMDTEFDLRRERDRHGAGRVYTITYKATDGVGNISYASATVTAPISKNNVVFEEPNLVGATIGQNYPNPFNPRTNIPYKVIQNGNVRIVMFDMQGREVAELANGYHEAGKYTAEFDGNILPSGTYICRMYMATGVREIKAVLMK
jgi:VCBS repeat protein